MTEGGPAHRSGSHTGLLSQSRWNLLGLACTLGAHFITVPFVVRWIGLEGFGRAGLVLAVAAPFTLFGTVIGQALVREVSSRGGALGDGTRNTLAAALGLGWMSSTVTGLGLALLGPLVAHWVTGSDASGGTVWMSFALAGAALFAQQMGLVLQGLAMAQQDFRRVAQMAASGGLASLVLCLAFTHARPDEVGYLAGVAAAFWFTMLAWCWLYRRHLRSGTAGPAHRREELRSLLRFGRWQGLAQVAGALGNQIDRYALGALAPVSVVGQYNVANRLQEASYMAVTKAGEVLFPFFGSISKAPLEQRQSVYVVGSWVLMTFSATVLAPIVPLADLILALWVGPGVGAETATLLRTLVLGGIVGCGSNVFSYYAMGIGQNAPVAWMSVGYSLTTVVLTVVLILAFGPLVAGVGLLLASVGRVAAAMVIARARFFPSLRWRDQFLSTVLPIVVGCGLALVVHLQGPGPWSGWGGALLAYPLLAAGVLASIIVLTRAMPGGGPLVAQALGGLRRLRRG
jgi:O-antigen/teichoic acid export membrane protein